MKSISVVLSKLLGIYLVGIALVGNAQNIANLSELTKKCDPAIVRIYTIGPDGQYDGQASGCMISNTGIGVTNFHVLAGAKKAIAIFPSGEKIAISKILDYNETSDLIKFQIESGASPNYLIISNDSIDKGESVFTIGYPNGFILQGESTLSTGIISGFRLIDGIRNIQTTAPITHGSSGGGLFNSKGHLCGITSGSFAASSDDLHANLNKVVPAYEINKLTRDMNLTLTQFFNDISKTNSLAKAVSHYEKGNFEQAFPLFQEHLKAIPSDATAWFKAGVCAYFLYVKNPENTEMMDFAIKSFEIGAYLDQTNYYAIGQLSLMYFVVGMIDEAKLYAKKCYELAPNEWFSNLVMGQCHITDENYEDALSSYDKAVSICRSANITTLNGIMYIDQIYLTRGAIKQKLNRHNEALEDYNTALEYNPDNTSALWAKFYCCYYDLKYTTKACETISLLYKRNPNATNSNFTVSQWKEAACGTAATTTGPYITFQCDKNNYIVANNGVTMGNVSPGKPLKISSGVVAKVTYNFDIYKVTNSGTPVFIFSAPVMVYLKYVVVDISNNSINMSQY